MKYISGDRRQGPPCYRWGNRVGTQHAIFPLAGRYAECRREKNFLVLITSLHLKDDGSKRCGFIKHSACISSSSQTLKMHRSIILLLSCFASIATAHFQLQFPSPRGVFDEDNEPSFCGAYRIGWGGRFADGCLLDGYNNPATNRTQFPLTNGIITLNSEHTQWTRWPFPLLGLNHF